MLVWVKTTLYSDGHIEPIYLLSGQNAECFYVKVGRAKSNHYALKGQNLPLCTISE
jgi:hypothetical protein